MTIESNLLKDLRIKHGFGEIKEPVPLSLVELWASKAPKFTQVHETRCVKIENSGQDCGDADGFYTDLRSQPVGVRTADCVPILLAKKDRTRVAAIHAGWKGTFKRIVTQFFLATSETEPSDWIAAIGPCIQSCCFEVSKELQSSFLKEFSSFGKDKISPKDYYIDLQRINAMLLYESGVREIDQIPFCTHCTKLNENERFHSFRRSQTQNRQWSIICL